MQSILEVIYALVGIMLLVQGIVSYFPNLLSGMRRTWVGLCWVGNLLVTVFWFTVNGITGLFVWSLLRLVRQGRQHEIELLNRLWNQTEDHTQGEATNTLEKEIKS